MAKKKATGGRVSKAKNPPESEGEADRVPFQVRFKRDVYEPLKGLSEETGISLNQMIEGICRACLPGMQAGVLQPDENAVYRHRRAQQCLYVGRSGRSRDEIHREMRERDKHIEYEDERCTQEDYDRVQPDPGRLWFQLDFRNLGVTASSLD